jgi:hypothetical protein
MNLLKSVVHRCSLTPIHSQGLWVNKSGNVQSRQRFRSVTPDLDWQNFPCVTDLNNHFLIDQYNTPNHRKRRMWGVGKFEKLTSSFLRFLSIVAIAKKCWKSHDTRELMFCSYSGPLCWISCRSVRQVPRYETLIWWAIFALPFDYSGTISGFW